MAELKTIASFLDALLDHRVIKDSSLNGLQVDINHDIKKIGFTVDAALDTFMLAKEQHCDLLIVHHGILWGDGHYPITGLMRERLRCLFLNNLSLYASHLPLDLHPVYGNNAQLARLLELKDLHAFGEYHGQEIGFQGTLSHEMSLAQFSKKIEILLSTSCKTLAFGKSLIKSVAIVSGGGASTLPQAIERTADLLLVGEFNHSHFHIAKEGKINLLAAGHYATETLGVMALMPVLKDNFGVETVFLDAETDL